MGISCERFVERQHEQFKCAICLEVSHPPIITNDCEHFFCQSCFQSLPASLNEKCPKCQSVLKNPKSFPIKGSIKRIYLDLKIKCLIDGCEHVSDLSNFEDHDHYCPLSIITCPDCGYQSGPQSRIHSCVQFLKSVIDSKNKTIDDKERKIKEIEKMIEDLEDQHKQLLEAVTNEYKEKIERDQTVINSYKEKIDVKDRIISENEEQMKLLKGKITELKDKQKKSVDPSNVNVPTGWLLDPAKISTLRIVFLGAPRVGKTQIIRRFSSKGFTEDYEPTLQPVISKVSYKQTWSDEGSFNAELIEFPGTDDFRINSDHSPMNGADLVIMVYDRTDYGSFKSLANWMQVLSKNDSLVRIPIILLGNKKDIKDNAFPKDEVGKWMNTHENVPKQYAISAKDGFGTLKLIDFACLCKIMNSWKLSEANMSFNVDVPTGWLLVPTKIPTLRIVFLGASRVGKTQIIKQFVDEHFTEDYEPTLKPVISTRSCKQYWSDGESIKIGLIEFPGTDDFRINGDHSLMKEADLVVLVYDNTDYESFKSLVNWMQVLSQINSLARISILLVENKTDLHDEAVPDDEVKKWKEAHKNIRRWHAISAKDGFGTDSTIDFACLCKIMNGSYRSEGNIDFNKSK